VIHLNVVFPYWEQPLMLREQVRHWEKWDSEILKATTFLICDDCSAEHPVDIGLLESLGLDIRVWRITKKEPWNWRAPKNICMFNAPDGWSLVTDIDHVLVRSQVKKLFGLPLDEDNAYFFKRRQAEDGSVFRNHTSSRLLTKEMFWKIGGYDESFVGTQSGWRGEYPRRVNLTAKATPTLPVYLLRYERTDIDDANVELPRRDDGPVAETREEKIVAGIKAGWTGIKVMTFPHERLL
jgi:hypothetical protein